MKPAGALSAEILHSKPRKTVFWMRWGKIGAFGATFVAHQPGGASDVTRNGLFRP
ncbi:hypothetical protein HMPREF0388_1440 [Mobiluncus curtisii ATCC 51333]|uniref:Uncharacterized protein n=1 Tax=Mobiluncus curtisii ATCC 51333 TaxID=887326 RepID=E6M057_9ACTO|nr:hypothetical protein HMPREF0388_1440 [Mobiluncus curtisii ATCC 51333]